MVSGQVHEIPMTGDESLVAFHLDLKRAAHYHHCFTGSMPMPRSDAAWSELSKENGWARARIASLNRYSEAFGSIRNGAEFGAGSRSDNWFLFSSLGGQTARQADDTHCSENHQKNARVLGKHHNASHKSCEIADDDLPTCNLLENPLKVQWLDWLCPSWYC